MPANRSHLTHHLENGKTTLLLYYCCIVWAGVENTKDLEKIHKIQKRYCRLITFSNFRSHTASLFATLKIFTIYEMYKYQVSMYMFKHLNNLLPIQQYGFQFNEDVHSHFTRQIHKLHNIYSRTRVRQRSMQYQGLKIWNSLPLEIKNVSGLNLFKINVKRHIFNLSYVP